MTSYGQYLNELGKANLPGFSTILRSQVGAGIYSGAAAGWLGANLDSVLSGNGPAPVERQIQSMLTFSLLGAGSLRQLGYLRSAGKA